MNVDELIAVGRLVSTVKMHMEQALSFLPKEQDANLDNLGGHLVHAIKAADDFLGSAVKL